MDPCSEFSFSPNVRSVKLFSSNHPQHPAQAPPPAGRRAEQRYRRQHGEALIPRTQSCLPWSSFTPTALCNSDTVSHIQLLQLCLHINSSSRGWHLGLKCHCPNKVFQTRQLILWRLGTRTVFPQGTLSRLWLTVDWTLKSLLRTSALWKFWLRKHFRTSPLSVTPVSPAALPFPACYKTSCRCLLSFRKQANINFVLRYFKPSM